MVYFGYAGKHSSGPAGSPGPNDVPANSVAVSGSGQGNAGTNPNTLPV